MTKLLLDILADLARCALRAAPTKLGVLLRRAVYKRLMRSCGDCDFATDVDISGFHNLEIGSGFSMNRHGSLHCQHSSIRIGLRCHINRNVRIGADGGGSVSIGNDVNIGPNTVIDPSNHVFARTDVTISAQGLSFGHIVIEDDVWIGANVVVTQGVRIGQGSVIGAGAVVTRDIPPYSVAVGVPARPKSSRRPGPQ